MVEFIKKIMRVWYAVKEAHYTIKEEKKHHQRQLEEANRAFDNTINSLMYKARYEQLLNDYKQLLNDYNKLVKRINEKGGEQFLQHATIQPAGIQLSKEDLRSLIQLCHPDKHGGKKSAVEMTKKLNIIRDSL